jgi:hypothetical protein
MEEARKVIACYYQFRNVLDVFFPYELIESDFKALVKSIFETHLW